MKTKKMSKLTVVLIVLAVLIIAGKILGRDGSAANVGTAGRGESHAIHTVDNVDEIPDAVISIWNERLELDEQVIFDDVRWNEQYQRYELGFEGDSYYVWEYLYVANMVGIA